MPWRFINTVYNPKGKKALLTRRWLDFCSGDPKLDIMVPLLRYNGAHIQFTLIEANHQCFHIGIYIGIPYVSGMVDCEFT